MVTSLRALLLIGAVAVLGTCSESPTAPSSVVTSVSIVGPGFLYLGASAQYQALAHDHGGNLITDRHIAWTSDSPAVASVDSVGLVATHTLGRTTIAATIDGVRGSAVVVVLLTPLAQVLVSPARDSVFVGDSIQLTATVRDIKGQFPSDRPIAWSVSDTTKASVSAAGLVRIRAAGGVAVRATSDTAHGGAFITGQLPVIAAFLPETAHVRRYHQVRIVPAFENSAGGEAAGRTTTWTSLDTAVIDVSDSGIVTPRDYGVASVVVAAEGHADTGVIMVDTEPVASVGLVQPLPGPVLVDSTQSIVVQPRDSATHPVPDPIAWVSSDTTVARVRPDSNDGRIGRVTGVRYGSAVIAAVAGGMRVEVAAAVALPTTRLVISPDSVSLRVNDVTYVFATTQDTDSHVASVVDPWFTVLDTTIAAVTSTIAPIQITGRKPGRTEIVAQLGALADTMPIAVRPSDSYRLVLALDQNTDLFAYSPFGVSIAVLDSAGAPTATGHDVDLSSSDTTIMTVWPRHITGLRGATYVTIMTLRAGAARLTANTDSVTAGSSVISLYYPPAGISLSPRTAVVPAGDSVRIVGRPYGSDGVQRNYPVTWSASDTAIATVSDSGEVHALNGGTLWVTATVAARRDSVAVIVRSATPPVVDSITPRPAPAGAIATLFGSGFDPDAAADLVTVDGASAAVTAATESTLSIVMPAAAAFPCAPTRWSWLVLSAGGRVAADTVQFELPTLRNLSVGQAIVASGVPATCNDLLDVDATYVFSIVNQSTNPAAVVPMEIHGANGPLTFASAGSPAPLPRAAAVPDFSPLNGTAPPVMRSPRVHRTLLERNRQLLQRLGSPLAVWQAARGQPRPARSANDTIGSLTEFRVPNLDDPNFCASYTTVTARRVYTGARAVIFEDVNAPLAGTNDAGYNALGAEFTYTMYPLLLANFGDPLAMDSLLDDNGRIVMLFTPLVDRYGAAGFVTACDYYPESLAPSSNTGEVFYARVPTAAGVGFDGDTRDEWFREIRTVVMHESKHLTAFSERIVHGTGPEDTWLEEATAVTAEELWSRGIYGTSWKGDAGYRQTLYCDVRPSWPECTGRPYSMFNAYAFLYDYAVARDSRTPLGPVSASDATFYGSGWSLLRWTLDQYAANEGQFLRALIDEPTLTGLANLAARAGQPAAQLEADWAVASAFDDDPSMPSANQWRIPSWDQVSIFGGMHADFPSFFGTGTPFAPGFSYDAGLYTIPIPAFPGGGATLFQEPGFTLARRMVQIRGLGGGPPPPNLTVEIIRVH